MATARAVNASDPFLLEWRKDTANPIDFGGGPGCSFPSGVWWNEQRGHFNLLSQGWRFSTNDTALHRWTRAPDRMMPYGERGGQWFLPIPTTPDGTPPAAAAAGGATHLVSTGGGNRFAFGVYDPSNESWAPVKTKGAALNGRTDDGPSANWMVGQFAGRRMMNIGWATGSKPMENFPNDGGYLTLLREVHFENGFGLVANPVEELAGLRNGSLANATAVTIAPNSTHYLSGTGGGAAASADVLVSFAVAGTGQPSQDFGACVLSEADRSTGVGVGVSLAPNRGGGFKADVIIAPCGNATVGFRPSHGWGSTTFTLLPGETTVDIRIVVDRSIVEAFVMGGRGVLTKTVHDSIDTNVLLFSGSGAVAKSAEVWSMGCGWDPVPYTDSPSL